MCISCTKTQTTLSENEKAVNPPIMGWSSWNAFRVDISEDIIKHQADLMVEKGLKDVGYHYVNIDAAYFLKALAAGQEADNYIIVQASAVVSDNESSEPVSYVFRYANAYITVDGDFNVGHDNQNKRFICGTDRGVLYEEYIGSLSDNYSIDRIDNN